MVDIAPVALATNPVVFVSLELGGMEQDAKKDYSVDEGFSEKGKKVYRVYRGNRVYTEEGT